MKPVLCATAQVLGTKDIDAGEGARILVSFCVYYLLLCLCAHAMGMFLTHYLHCMVFVFRHPEHPRHAAQRHQPTILHGI